MNYRHVILEGKPTTGKTEVSDLFKIYFPSKVRILPELTTVLVRQNKLNILRDRKELNSLLREAVPARSAEVREILAADPDVMVFEESHMGVHWAYSKFLGDKFFLDLYAHEIRHHVLVPDIFMRLDIPVGLSIQRQKARATKDVEVDGTIISEMFANLNQWHEDLGAENLVVVNTNRSPDVVIGEILGLLGLEYDVFSS